MESHFPVSDALVVALKRLQVFICKLDRADKEAPQRIVDALLRMLEGITLPNDSIVMHPNPNLLLMLDGLASEIPTRLGDLPDRHGVVTLLRQTAGHGLLTAQHIDDVLTRLAA